MDPNIISSIILAVSTIIAALIAVSGAAIIIKARKSIIKLCEEVEAYHKQETYLVGKILDLENKKNNEKMITRYRGVLRNEAAEPGKRPTMTANDAIKLKRRFLFFD